MKVDGQLASLLPDFLVRQRWFAGSETPASVEIVDRQILDGNDLVDEATSDGGPALLWVLVVVPGDDAAYQVPVGLRPLDRIETWLEGKGRSLIGDVEGDDGAALLAYDAMIDPELVPILLEQTAPGAVSDTSTRALAVEQSNTSVIVGEQAVLKVFRRVHDGPNPDVEVVEALATVGFEATPRPLGTWRRGGRDLAVARSFLSGSTDGWHLAITSLRDLYDRRLPPEECGGDFGPDAGRLGGLVAQLHLGLAAAFGQGPGEPTAWAAALSAGLGELGDHELLEDARRRYAVLAELDRESAGPAIRVHGDLHLGQLLRNDDGWYVLDFEGEPRIPLPERRNPSSALRDAAGMLRSFHYATEAALMERHEPVDDELHALASAWEDRASSSFLGGYLNEPGIDALLPADDRGLQIVLGAFELGKAVYEVGYERAHRPDWLPIPTRAVERMLA